MYETGQENTAMKCPLDVYKTCCKAECPYWVEKDDADRFMSDVRTNLSGAPLCPSQCSLSYKVYYREAADD